VSGKLGGWLDGLVVGRWWWVVVVVVVVGEWEIGWVVGWSDGWTVVVVDEASADCTSVRYRLTLPIGVVVAAVVMSALCALATQ
jgi:hypothetical protein